MLTAEQARSRVDERLSRIAGVGETGEAVVDLSVAAYTCPGTDVAAPDLEMEIRTCAAEFVLKVADGADPINCLNGAVLRTFWLGFEYGKAAKD